MKKFITAFLMAFAILLALDFPVSASGGYQPGTYPPLTQSYLDYMSKNNVPYYAIFYNSQTLRYEIIMSDKPLYLVSDNYSSKIYLYDGINYSVDYGYIMYMNGATSTSTPTVWTTAPTSSPVSASSYVVTNNGATTIVYANYDMEFVTLNPPAWRSLKSQTQSYLDSGQSYYSNPPSNTAPSISSTYSFGSIYPGTNISIPYIITDVEQSSGFTAIYKKDGIISSVSNLSSGENIYDAGTFALGSHSISIEVTDSEGKVSNRLEYNFEVVQKPLELPVITSEFTSGSVFTTNDNVNIVYRVTDPDSSTFILEYTVDGVTNSKSVTLGVNTLQLGRLNEGTHNVTFKVKDSDGNYSNVLDYSIVVNAYVPPASPLKFFQHQSMTDLTYSRLPGQDFYAHITVYGDSERFPVTVRAEFKGNVIKEITIPESAFYVPIYLGDLTKIESPVWNHLGFIDYRVDYILTDSTGSTKSLKDEYIRYFNPEHEYAKQQIQYPFPIAGEGFNPGHVSSRPDLFDSSLENPGEYTQYWNGGHGSTTLPQPLQRAATYPIRIQLLNTPYYYMETVTSITFVSGAGKTQYSKTVQVMPGAFEVTLDVPKEAFTIFNLNETEALATTFFSLKYNNKAYNTAWNAVSFKVVSTSGGISTTIKDLKDSNVAWGYMTLPHNVYQDKFYVFISNAPFAIDTYRQEDGKYKKIVWTGPGKKESSSSSFSVYVADKKDFSLTSPMEHIGDYDIGQWWEEIYNLDVSPVHSRDDVAKWEEGIGKGKDTANPIIVDDEGLGHFSIGKLFEKLIELTFEIKIHMQDAALFYGAVFSIFPSEVKLLFLLLTLVSGIFTILGYMRGK